MSFIRFPDSGCALSCTERYTLSSTEMVIISTESSSYSEAGNSEAWDFKDGSVELVGYAVGRADKQRGNIHHLDRIDLGRYRAFTGVQSEHPWGWI